MAKKREGIDWNVFCVILVAQRVIRHQHGSKTYYCKSTGRHTDWTIHNCHAMNYL